MLKKKIGFLVLAAILLGSGALAATDPGTANAAKPAPTPLEQMLGSTWS